MGQEQNLDIANLLMAAFFSGDRDAIQALVADDFVLIPPRGSAHHGDYRGSTGFLRFVETFGAVYDLRTADHVASYPSADGSVIILEFHLAGTIRATGVPFDTSVLEAWDFAGGKLVRIRPHWFEVATPR